MVAPGPGVAGTPLAGASGTSAPIAAPAGVTSGQIILVDLYLEASRTVTPPDGTWTEVGTRAATTTTWHHRFWKRASASDSGTYDFTWTGSTYRRGAAVRYPGCVASGTPYDTGAGAPVSAARSSAGTVTPAVSLTTQGIDRLLVWSGTSFSAGTWSPPTAGGTWTERYDSNEVTGAEKAQAAAGATGSVTGTSSASDNQTAWLLALIPGDVAVTIDDTAPAGVVVGSPTGESVEALSINLTLDDTVPAGTAIGSPAGETVSVDIPDTVPAAHLHGSPSGENVGVSISDTVPAAGLVRSPSGETAVAAEPGLPAGGAPFVSLWAVDPDTGGLVHLPHALKVDLSPIRNSGGSFRFTYPAFGKNFEFLHNRLIDDQVAVEVELWVGGSRFNALGGDVLQVEGDDVAEESVWTFTGQFFTHRLSWATVVHDPAQDKGERHFGAATAGTIMRTFLQEAQGRGTLTDLTFATFSTTHDSAGVPWANTVTMKFTPHADGGLLSVLNRLVALGLCEGEVDRDKRFLLYNAGGAGRDLTTRNPPVILRRAKDLLESNRRIDIGASGTDVYGTGAEGLYADAFDASARARWGQQIEKVVDSNQIENQGALDAFVQASRESVVLAPMELTHGLVFGTNRPAPVSGFRINDWLYSDVGRGLERVRVAQWVLSQDTSGITGSVTLNDIIADRLTRLARRLAALANGDAVVGTSNPPVDDGLAPAAPTGVTVDSVAYNDGYDTYATLIVGWSVVNTNSDGSAATDIAGYRVQWRPQVEGADSWRPPVDAAGGTVTSTSFGGVGSGVDVLVRVAAYDTVGNQSAWSAEVVILTETDSTPPPTPSTPTGGPYLGQAKIVWNGLGSAGETMPADLDFVELQMSLSAGFGTFSVVDAFSTIAGERVITDLPYTVTHYFRLVAVDRTRPVANRSAPSGVLAIVPEKLVQIDIGPNAIGQAQIIDLEVVTAKIDNLAVNDAKFGSGSFGKLTAGVISVAVTNAGIIRSGTAGQRYELDAAALRFYDSGGTQTVQLNGALNWILGELRTGLTGTRLVANPGGTNPDRIDFYPSSGSAKAMLQTRTFVGQALIDMIGGTTRGDGKTGQAGCHPEEGYVRWGLPESTTPHSYAVANEFATEVTGPQLDFIVEQRFDNALGDDRKMSFQLTNSSGTGIANSLLWLRWGGINQPWLARVNGNCGVLFDANSVSIVNGGGSFGPVAASAFNVNSSEAVKEDVADARALLDPLATIRAARAVKFRYSADKWFTPPPTEENPSPEPVQVEAPERVGVLVEELPEVLQVPIPQPDGTVSLGTDLASQLGVMWGALGQIQDQEIRTVAGRAALPNGTYLPGVVTEVAVVWDETPLEVPTGGIVTVYAAIAWLGKTTARIVPGSITATGCTVEVRALAAVVPSAANPITVEAQALFLYAPPFIPEEP